MTPPASLQALRIAALLAVIFLAGLFTGRWTAPQPAPTTAPLVVAAPSRVPADMILGRLTSQLDLDASQQDCLRKVLEQMTERMRPFPPASEGRLKVFRDGVPEMRACLRQDQIPMFNRFVRRMEQAFARAIGTPN